MHQGTAEFLGREGWRVPIHFGLDKNIPAEAELMDVAGDMASKHAEVCGGEWEVVRSENE